MKNTVFCLWSHGRRPVRALPRLGLVDLQAQVPAGWCGSCGAEVYRPGKEYCTRCCGTERSNYESRESL